jgi:protein phosphatase
MEPALKPGPPYRLRWSGLTDRGKVRKNNEDAFLAVQFDARELRYLGKVGEDTVEHNDFVFAVSDGMGGAMAGEFASRIAVDKIAQLMPRSYKLSVEGLGSGFADVMQELFVETHRAITYLGHSYEECAGMGATLSLAWFTPGWMYFGHIGDSRIYYLAARDGTFRQITDDDTYVGWLFRKGEINEREARAHPRRNVLQRALGAGNQFVDPQVGAVNCEPGDIFLLCTDGVVDGLHDASLADYLRAAPAGGGVSAQDLVKTAVEAAGRDNTTAVIIEVLEA